jgi:hypothetical protein
VSFLTLTLSLELLILTKIQPSGCKCHDRKHSNHNPNVYVETGGAYELDRLVSKSQVLAESVSWLREVCPELAVQPEEAFK